MLANTPFVIFPNQLFYDESVISFYRSSKSPIFIIEEPIVFYDPKYRPIRPNKVKLAYMVACMYAYRYHLHSQGIRDVKYVKYNDVSSVIKETMSFRCWDPCDFDIRRKYPRAQFLEDSPYFILSSKKVKELQVKNHAAFYKVIQKELGLSLKSQDEFNRQSIPSNLSLPPSPSRYSSPYYKQASSYIENHPIFSKNTFVGSTMNVSLYPLTLEDAKVALIEFISKKMDNYGPYQDAIRTEHSTLWHSFLSAATNMGILPPKHIVETLQKNRLKLRIPLQSYEGYIRQLIGWREYCRYVYVNHYQELKSANHFSANKRLPKSWWQGTTGLTPIDKEIIKARDLGYAHHIIRLMVFLNFMVLDGIKPNDMYKWFMEVVSIDAWDWVMWSNIMMMSHYWPGGMRKPYISTSAYIKRMSNYREDSSGWAAKWDRMFYDFIEKQRGVLAEDSSAIYLRHLRS